MERFGGHGHNDGARMIAPRIQPIFIPDGTGIQVRAMGPLGRFAVAQLEQQHAREWGELLTLLLDADGLTGQDWLLDRDGKQWARQVQVNASGDIQSSGEHHDGTTEAGSRQPDAG